MKERKSQKWRANRKAIAGVARPTSRRKLRGQQIDAAISATTQSPRSPVRADLKEKREHRKTLREQRRREYNGEGDTLRLLQTTMDVVSRSQKSLKDVYLDGGPTPSTLTKWRAKKVKRPGLMTVLGALQACGNLRIAIIDEKGEIVS